MRRLILTAALFSMTSPALAWGPIGHRVTGAIADRNLSGLARANVQLLLGEEKLAQAATWPDDMKSDPADFWQKQANPWHYVTVREGDAYTNVDAPAEGDAMTALTRFTATLRNPAASIDDKRLALRFVVHIIGDLHMKVSWFGRSTNLHSVWDSAMIEQRSLSYSELADWLARAITPEQVIAWNNRDPGTWIRESIALRKTIYPTDTNLSWDYAYQHRLELDDRLKRGGIRIAVYLNWVFENSQDQNGVEARSPRKPARRK
jgi:S1/P1 Nuclease